MYYNPNTGSYCNDFMEEILDTGIKCGIPYKIDREKYEQILKSWNQSVRVKVADVVSFSMEYSIHDSREYGYMEIEEEPYLYSFFAFTSNSPEDSDDFYECILFDWYQCDNKHKEKFEEFAKEFVQCVIGPDPEYCNKLIQEKTDKMTKIQREIISIQKIKL